MPKDPRIKKVLVIGSGPIIIGQAAEFDYSGTQACRALKSEGVETVLVNSNPATIMTDPDIADHVYIEPLTAEVIERIIEKEKPDAILPNLGGQMGLNLSMELARNGFLDRSGVRLLACKPDTIDRAEDRQLFKDTMEKLNQPCIPSKVVEESLTADGIEGMEAIVTKKGGYTAAYESGFIVERVKASAAAKDKNIATRRQTLLGANQFPNFTEVAPKEITAEAVTRPAAEGNVLTPYRGAMAFEAMRLHVDRSGKQPKAFMLTCGNLAMARARAQFSCNFFACAGIRVQDNTFFKSIEEGAKAALESKAEIVVVCASDDDYAEAAPKVKELLAGKAILVVAGAPACAPELEAQGITNFISVKSNVLETLKFYLKEMGI